MASYTYSISQGQLITAAFSLMGVYDADSTPSSGDLSTATVALNLMLKEWMTKNYNLWCVTDVPITLTQGLTSYKLGPGTPTAFAAFRPLRIPMARLIYANTTPPLQVPLIELSRQEYNLMGQPSAQGTSNSYYYDPQLIQGVLYLYLTPDANPNTVVLTCQRPLADAINSTDSLDFPIEWQNALRYNLAANLIDDFDVPEGKANRITMKAQKMLDDMLDWDQENASTFFTVNRRPAGRM